MKVSSERLRSKALVYFLLTLGAAFCFLPVFWLVRSSVMTLGDIFKFPPIVWPAHIRWQNFADAMSASPFLLYFRNTMIVLIPNVVGSLLTASMSAYGLARFRFPLRNFWFALVLGAIILPPAVVLIPQFLLWSKLHLVNTFLPLTVPVWFGGGAFNVFLLRQFFLTIPKELEDAARIDGAGRWTVYLRVILPLSGPGLAALAAFVFVGSWNDYFWPSIVLTDPGMLTLPVGLAHMNDMYVFEYSRLMAGSVISIAPAVLLYLLFQRFITRGVVMTGLKG